MKTTLEIPDDLYRQAKVQTRLNLAEGDGVLTLGKNKLLVIEI